MTSKLAAGPAPDLLLAAEVGVVPEPQELVHTLPEDPREGGVGPPGSGPKQPAPDSETDKYKFSISSPSSFTIIVMK